MTERKQVSEFTGVYERTVIHHGSLQDLKDVYAPYQDFDCWLAGTEAHLASLGEKAKQLPLGEDAGGSPFNQPPAKLLEQVKAAVQSGDARKAAMRAFLLAHVLHFLAVEPAEPDAKFRHDHRKRMQQTHEKRYGTADEKKQRRQRCAECVHELLRKSSMSMTAASSKVAKSEGLNPRTVLRYYKDWLKEQGQ